MDMTPFDAVRPAIDLRHLAKYTLANRDLDCEILALFVSETDRLLADLKASAAMPGGDGDVAWKNAAHALKGSARGIGAFDLADLAAHCEAHGRCGGMEGCVALVAQLHAAHERVRAFVAEFMTGPSRA